MNFSKKLNLIVLIVAFGVLFNCCSTYPNNQMVFTNINGKYSTLDTLIIENFVIQNVEYRNFPERKSGLKINQDSTLGIFLQNIEFIGLKVKLDSNASNQVGENPIPYLHYFSKKKNRREYSSKLEVNKNKIILYPVIEFSNRFFLSQYGDITGHMLTISIFVFKDGKQVYCATNKQSNNCKPMHGFIDISKLYITHQQWKTLTEQVLLPFKNSIR
jgi:hypothetical protein